jgi:hypothetical protein
MQLSSAPAILRCSATKAAQTLAATARRRGREPSDHPVPIRAYVNHGRWLADCVCGAGVAVDPAWDRAYCYDCLRIFRVTWPPDRKLAWIETILAARPLAQHQNWWPTESVAQLARENGEHGLGTMEVPDDVD